MWFISTTIKAITICMDTFSSDLRKFTAVSESLSKFNIIYSLIENITWYINMIYVLLHCVCFSNLHCYSQSTFMSSASSISLWKLYITSCLLILTNLLLGVVLTGVFVMILCSVALDGVWGGVMGTVCCIVFRILSSFLDFVWDGMLGITTCGNISYFNFSR